MIKVSRNGVDVKVVYTDESEKERIATAFCKNIELAQELVDEVQEAINQGYGFAKCRSILEGDSLPQHGGKRQGSGRPSAGDDLKKPRSIKFSDAEWDWLKQEASRQGITISEYIRSKVLYPA